MIKRFQRYIENEPWDDKLEGLDERYVKKACWTLIVIAALYFGTAFWTILTR